MITPMTQISLLGRREDLDPALRTLQQLRVAEVAVPAALDPSPGSSIAATLDQRPDPELVDLERELAMVADLADRLPGGADLEARLDADPTTDLGPDPDGDLRAQLPQLVARTSELSAAAEEARIEIEQLTGQVAVLSRLSDLLPELAALDDAELEALGLATVVVVIDDPDGRIVDLLRQQLAQLLGDRFLLVTSADATSEGVGCLAVLPRRDVGAVESLLGADRITKVDVPAAFAGSSLAGTVGRMRRRLEAATEDLEHAEQAIANLLAVHAPRLRRLRRHLAEAVERQQAIRSATLGERTFSLRLWVPRPRLQELVRELARTLPTVVVARVPAAHLIGEPPVLLRTRRAAQPYSRLVGFLSWPSPGGIDPSGLMAAVLPFLFGVMVGDVVYGAVLAAGGWWLRRRFADRPVMVDAGRILFAGGIWATIFGFLFGEALGSLGNTLGMPALWFYRGGPAALTPLLLFAVALGAAHIVLGLLLGLWSAARNRQLPKVADRAGTLLVLCALFALAGVLASVLPTALLTPAVAAMVVGLVVVSVAHGPLGVLLGPLELLGAIGNVLSYLRVAAVGLASVYLANVANELAANSPLILGVLIAVFFHVLNLALAAFSPTVQALRLHYVEFFSKFHDGGGRAFRPLGSALHDPAPQPVGRPPSERSPVPAPASEQLATVPAG